MKQTNTNQIPQHIAVIMDGNRRWAKKHNLPAHLGHRQGAKKILSLSKWCIECKIKYLTLYCLSVENLQRTPNELKYLFGYINRILDTKNINFIQNNNIKITILGNMCLLPRETQAALNQIQNISRDNTGLNMQLCIGYGGRQEIITAIHSLVDKIISNSHNNQNIVDDISIDTLQRHLYTANIPEPDLMIRCGGEKRLSNFLLWQLSYTELYFTKTLWPAFGKKDFLLALYNYTRRMRRYGK